MGEASGAAPAPVGPSIVEQRGGEPGSRAGKPFTKAGKKEVWEKNAQDNGGKNACSNCGRPVVKPQQHVKGETPPSNEGHVDHVDPKSRGGSGTAENGDLLCRGCNLEKSDRPITPPPPPRQPNK